MLKLYGIPNCNTVKKARIWLDEHGIAYEFYDFKKKVLSPILLEQWLEQQPWGKLINRSGLTWRGLTDEEKATVVDSPSAIPLMLEKPSLIKRPVLVSGHQILALGFDEKIYLSLIDA